MNGFAEDSFLHRDNRQLADGQFPHSYWTISFIILSIQLAGKKKHVRPLLIERVQLQHEVSSKNVLFQPTTS